MENEKAVSRADEDVPKSPRPTGGPARFVEIDFLKVAGILAVILIHSLRAPWDPRISSTELWLGIVTRFAVPGFLFCSGFLYATSTQISFDTVVRRLRRVLVPYLICSIGRARRDLFERPAHHDATLDGLRALAVLMVLAFHCSIFSSYATPRMEAAGELHFLQQRLINLWSGVDVFFVLSGFLIGRILLRDIAREDRVFWLSFMLRRSFRIIPLYYLVLTVILFIVSPSAPRIYRLLWGTRDFSEISTSAWANYLYISNYWLAPGEPNPMSWAWSLCIEEHFYLILPPLLWLTIRKRSRRWHLVGFAIGLGGPFVARLTAYAMQPVDMMGQVYTLSHYRFDELFVGVVAAYFHLHHTTTLRRIVKRMGLWLPAFGIGAFICVWTFGSPRQGSAFSVLAQFPLLAWGTAAILIHGMHANNGPVRRTLEWKGWLPIARVSYGIYLIHPILLFMLLAGPFRPIFEHANKGALLIVLFGCVTLVSWVIAALLYSLYERPLIDFGGRLAARNRRMQSERAQGLGWPGVVTRPAIS